MTVSKGAAGFQNCEEVLEPQKLRIRGNFPRTISGVLWRTGPGTFTIPTEANGTFHISHWEDSEPTVYYSSRNAAKKDEDFIRKHGVYDAQTFAQQDPCKRLFRRLFQVFVPAKLDSVNVGVNITPDMPGISKGPNRDGQPSKLVMKTDRNQIAVVDPETLEVEDVQTYTDLLGIKGQISGTHSCTDRGFFFNYVLYLGPVCWYKVFCIDEKTGKGTVLATIYDAPPAYLHSMMVTEKYAILSVWQADYTFNGLSILGNRNCIDAFEGWAPERKTIFYVIDRTVGGKGVVAKLTAPSAFAFHHVNAYDDGNDVIIDIITYNDYFICTSGLMLDNLRSKEALQTMEVPKFTRYRLPTDRKKGKAELLWRIPHCIELPVVNPAYYHSKYRYAYGIFCTKEGRKAGFFLDSIAKVDTSDPKDKMKVWTTEGVPGEPIFIANEGASEEDDGVLLTVVFDLKRGKSALVALDAQKMIELGRAEMASVMPYGFHGVFRARK